MGFFRNEAESQNAADVVAKMERDIGTTVVALRERTERPVVRRRETPSEYNSAY